MTTAKSSNGGSNKISSRLIDYVCFVGVDKSEVSFHDAQFSLYQPQLLKRYPLSDHKVGLIENFLNIIFVIDDMNNDKSFRLSHYHTIPGFCFTSRVRQFLPTRWM